METAATEAEAAHPEAAAAIAAIYKIKGYKEALEKLDATELAMGHEIINGIDISTLREYVKGNSGSFVKNKLRDNQAESDYLRKYFKDGDGLELRRHWSDI